MCLRWLHALASFKGVQELVDLWWCNSCLLDTFGMLVENKIVSSNDSSLVVTKHYKSTGMARFFFYFYFYFLFKLKHSQW